MHEAQLNPSNRTRLRQSPGLTSALPYKRYKIREITDDKHTYQTLCDTVYVIGSKIIDLEAPATEDTAHGNDRTKDNPFSND